MADSKNPASLLVADIGSLLTKVALVDRVGAEHRFVGAGRALTTVEPPLSDLLVGVRRATERVEASTHRALVESSGRLVTPEAPGGQGVDACVAITSAGLPLRVAVVGLSREVSVASAVRAVNSTYATVEATLALDETGGRWLRTPAPPAQGRDHAAAAPPPDPAVMAAEALAQVHPEVIVLVGGIDGGATTALYEMANLVATVAASREEGTRPIVIFAGNRKARPQIASRVGQIAPLLVADNVTPALDREDLGALRRELEELYIERRIGRLPGWNGINGWTAAPILPSARAFENVVRFLSRRYRLRVLGADIGGTATTIVTAHGDSFSRVVRADLGLGYTLENLMSQAGVDHLAEWLPFEITADELISRYLDRALSPWTIPATPEDARIVQAAARAALATTAREGRVNTSGVDLIVLTGGVVSHQTNLGAAALLALDALQPRGIMTLAIDTLGLAPAFGALAAVSPEAAASVIERDGFLTLGTVIAPISTNREGQVDLRVQVRPAGSGAISLEVQHGSLEVVPLAAGQKASLEVRAASGVDLGTLRRDIFKAEVEGGAIGLIFDARGRPITLPAAVDKRHPKIQEWLWDVGA